MSRRRPLDLERKERIEIEAWRTSATEAPGRETVENIVNKITDGGVLLEAIERHREIFERADPVLEIGAGQGWAACALKARYGPPRRVFSSDISVHAVRSKTTWERVFGATLDGAVACRSYEIPFASHSFDLVFAFQAAHHFVEHERTLNEVARVLRQGGVCLYLHEPCSPRYLYALARRRVNMIRPEVPEDVLVASEFVRIARVVGMSATSRYDLSLAKRGPLETLYYAALRLVPGLRTILPCTRDFVFIKD